MSIIHTNIIQKNITTLYNAILFEFKGKKFLFIYIPKTTGGSVEHFFYRNARDFDRKNLYSTRNFDHDGKQFNSSGQHLKYSEIKTIINVDDYEIFSIVRNPYDRFVSEMEYCIQKIKRYSNKDKKNKKELLHDFIMWYFGIKSFDDTNFNTNTFDNHKIPQYELLETCDRLHIIRYETLNEDFEKKFGEKLDTTHNKTDRLSFQEYYTKETEEFIYNYYRTDFELFKYERLML